LTYKELEYLVGDFLGEPGTDTSAWYRYSQSSRQDGIAKAELEAAIHLSVKEVPGLLSVQNDIVCNSSDIITTEALPQNLLEVIELYDQTTSPAIRFKYLDERWVKLRNNLNLAYGYYWYYDHDGDMKLLYPTTYDPDGVDVYQDIRYKRYPPSHDHSMWVAGTQRKLLIHGAVGTGAGGDGLFAIGETLTGGTSAATGVIAYVGNGYVYFTGGAGQFVKDEVVTSDVGNDYATLTFADGEFGNSETPFEKYADAIAMGAAGYVLTQGEGDPRADGMLAGFYAGFGVRPGKPEGKQ